MELCAQSQVDVSFRNQVSAIVDRLRPEGFIPVSCRAISVDGEAAQLIRHERADGRNVGLGGEHVSLVVDGAGRLKGFVRFDQALLDCALPTRNQARDIALDVLREAAPDLLSVLEIHWIEPHDEPLRIAGADRTVTGMKVKMRNRADGRWFWVIVGSDAQPIVFERDIVWIDFPGRRATEKWLHDSWLSQHKETSDDD